MRKIASLLSMLMLLSALAFGQQSRVVNGQVRDDKGDPIPFATILETGTKNATKADGNGAFSIKIKQSSSLTISAAGHSSKTVTPGTGLQTITLEVKAGENVEVVVTTALGIKKRPKEVGYANTTIRNEQITVGKSPNLGEALSGKVAGLTIYNTNGAVNSQPRIVLRGNRSILGDNTAMIVLDGVPVPQNTINYLNPNDVESVTVLKGGQAATLYGSDGVNGVLVITTKKGNNRVPQVNFSSTVNMDEVSYLPKFQTEYGSGSGYGKTKEENFRPFENQEYGDRFDGSIRAAGRRLADGSVLQLPYSTIPNIHKKIWDKGVTTQNDISISGGDASSTYYLSVQDVNIKGVVPKDQYRRDAFRFNASKTYGKFKASFDGTYTLDRAQRTNADFYFYALNTNSWIPLDQLKDWKNNPFANLNGYFNDYYENPWFQLDNNRNDGRNFIFNGNLNLNFKPFRWMEVNYRAGTAITNSFYKSWTNRFDYSDYAKGLLPVKPTTVEPGTNDYSYVWRAINAPVVGGVTDGGSYGNRIASDLIITFSKDWGNFTSKLIIGNSLQQRTSKTLTLQSGSVIIPELFNVSNRSGELTAASGENNTTIRKSGNFADLQLGFKDYLFVHGTFRYDQSSVFYKTSRPANLYSYPYYGADVSFVLTDAVPAVKSDIVNFVKIHGSWNRNGNDNLGPYSLDPTYSPGGGFPYGSVVGVTVNNDYPSPTLQPEFTYTTEGGFEATLWRNKINIDFTAYTQNAHNQVLSQSISTATGFSTTTLNAAMVKNNGLEVEFRANVFKNRDWSIDINANYSHNINKVEKLIGGLSRIQLNNASTYAYIYAELGQPFPYLKTTHWQIDSGSGKTIIDPTNGWPMLASDLKGQGSTTPHDDLGLGTKISYKNWTLSANAEFRGGYVVFSNLGNTMAFTGSTQATNIYHRDQFIFPNSVYWDGSKYVSNTTIPVANWYAIYYGWGDYGNSNGILYNGDYFTYSGNFWKIRDVALAYNFPQKWIRKMKVVKNITLSAWGRNVYTWLPKSNWYTDPEYSNTTGIGTGINVTGNTPPSLQFGGTLNVNF
ncbi:MAG TPA: SusC/RagA family TonB-linked outer membrane protein [Chitinophagaceae bacterium]|nr:SusC/RagA family TonB-linked outer membrane protein [Chitinophagaceae bacterium]